MTSQSITKIYDLLVDGGVSISSELLFRYVTMSSVLILIVLYSVLIFYQSVVCCGVVLLEDLLRVVGKGRAYRSHNWLLKQ